MTSSRATNFLLSRAHNYNVSVTRSESITLSDSLKQIAVNV